jgi:hypothetical protein
MTARRILVVAAAVALAPACERDKPLPTGLPPVSTPPSLGTPSEPPAPPAHAAARSAPSAPSPPPAPPPGARLPVVALAVDQSASMRGFAATGAITTAIESGERAIREATHGSPAFYALGETADVVTEAALFDPANYTKAGADLRAALAARALRDADILVAFTDGQPTVAHGPRAPLGMCTPAGTQVISDLRDWFAGYLDADKAAWLVLEKLPFTGRFFLNCRDANKVPEIERALHGRLQCDAHECSYLIPKAQDRALVAIVLAAPAFADAASALVERYLRDQHTATTTAVRLHRSARDHHVIDGVSASLIGAHAAYPVKVDTDAGSYAIHARCPEDHPDMAVRVCVRLRAQTLPPGQPLAEMDPPVIADADTVHNGRTLGDWLELPPGQSLDPALLPSLHAAQHDCPTLGPKYLGLADHGHHGDGPAECAGGDGVEVHELITACGCHASKRDATAIEFVQRYHSTEDGAARELSAKQLSADPRLWFEQPDRVNGLAELVHLLAAPRPADATPSAVLRLVIDVHRP